MWSDVVIGVVVVIAAIYLAAMQVRPRGAPNQCEVDGCYWPGTEICVRRGLWVCTSHRDGRGENVGP